MVPLIDGLRTWSITNLGAKVFAISVTLIFILSLLAVLSVEMGGSSLEEAIGEDTAYIASRMSKSVDRGIYLKYHEMTILSLGYVIRMALEESNIAFDAMADPSGYINDTDADWTAIPPDQITPFMQSILDNDLSRNLSERLDEHYVIEHGVDVYSEILVANKYGALIAMTSRSLDYTQWDDEWWQITVRDGFYIGDISYDECVQAYGVPVCLCVYSYSGEFAGVMRAFLDISALAEEVGLFEHRYETENFRILTSGGSLIFSSMAYRMMVDVSEHNYFQNANGDSGYFVTEDGERMRIFGYYRSNGYLDYGGHDWLVLVSYDYSEVFEPVSDLRTNVLTMAAVMTLVGILATSLFARSMTAPILKMTRTANEMSQGKLDLRLGIDRKDEIGQLANAFDGMAAELNELYDGLEEKVALRTNELEAANKKLNILGSITRHDALNQLSVLRGWLSLAQETITNEASQQYLEKVEAAADNIVSYMEFTGEYEKVGVKSPEWISVSESFVTGTFGLNLAGVKVKAELNSLEVYADPMFPRVLRNLVDNSLKHGRNVTAISLTLSESSDGLTMVYEDDGEGVPAELKEKIFDRMPRGGRKSYGLYLSREILRITGMSIKEVGVPGKGARFEISIPHECYRFGQDGSRSF